MVRVVAALVAVLTLAGCSSAQFGLTQADPDQRAMAQTPTLPSPSAAAVENPQSERAAKPRPSSARPRPIAQQAAPLATAQHTGPVPRARTGPAPSSTLPSSPSPASTTPKVGSPEWEQEQAERERKEKRIDQMIRSICRGC